MRNRVRLFFWIFLALLFRTDAFGQGIPIVLTGVLIGPDEELSQMYPYFEVSLEGEIWKLRIREVETHMPGNHERSVLRPFGRFLSFVGPDTLLYYLRSKDSEGLPLRLTGRLYSKKRTFLLSRVESAGPDAVSEVCLGTGCDSTCRETSDCEVEEW